MSNSLEGKVKHSFILVSLSHIYFGHNTATVHKIIVIVRIESNALIKIDFWLSLFSIMLHD